MKKFFLTLMFVVAGVFATNAQGLPGGLAGLQEANEDCTTVYYEYVSWDWFMQGFIPTPRIKIYTRIYKECASGTKTLIGETTMYVDNNNQEKVRQRAIKFNPNIFVVDPKAIRTEVV